MADKITFSDNFEDFVKEYQFKDEIYTKGSELIPSFRVMQAWDYYMDKFRNALYQSNKDPYEFGQYCKKILKDMGEIG